MASVPVVAPTVFPVVVPMFTFPPSTEIPEKIPAVVAVPIVVEKLILLTVFPCTFDTVVVPTVISIPLYKVDWPV